MKIKYMVYEYGKLFGQEIFDTPEDAREFIETLPKEITSYPRGVYGATGYTRQADYKVRPVVVVTDQEGNSFAFTDSIQ